MLQEDCGFPSISIIDAQHCWMLLILAGVKAPAPGANAFSRPGLEFLLAQYGLVHPNKQKNAMPGPSDLVKTG